MCDICKSVSAICLFICYKSTGVYQANVHTYPCKKIQPGLCDSIANIC